MFGNKNLNTPHSPFSFTQPQEKAQHQDIPPQTSSGFTFGRVRQYQDVQKSSGTSVPQVDRILQHLDELANNIQSFTGKIDSNFQSLTGKIESVLAYINAPGRISEPQQDKPPISFSTSQQDENKTVEPPETRQAQPLILFSPSQQDKNKTVEPPETQQDKPPISFSTSQQDENKTVETSETQQNVSHLDFFKSVSFDTCFQIVNVSYCGPDRQCGTDYFTLTKEDGSIFYVLASNSDAWSKLTSEPPITLKDKNENPELVSSHNRKLAHLKGCTIRARVSLQSVVPTRFSLEIDPYNFRVVDKVYEISSKY